MQALMTPAQRSSAGDRQPDRGKPPGLITWGSDDRGGGAAAGGKAGAGDEFRDVLAGNGSIRRGTRWPGSVSSTWILNSMRTRATGNGVIRGVVVRSLY